MSGSESIARLQFCLRVVRERLADPRYCEQRWFWEVREKVAFFALRSMLHDLDDLHGPELSAEDQRTTLATHPLLMPYLPPPIAPVSGERRALQDAVRRKVAQSYLGPRPPLASTPTTNGV